jgi:hypothetical protein
MIEAVAVGVDGTVYSVFRVRGVSHVVHHTAEGARSVYESTEAMRGLWIAPDGVVHAGGKRHHTNASGAWKAGPTGGGAIYTMWGSDGDVFAGTADGEVLRLRAGAWVKIGAVGGTIFGIHGTSARDVTIVGDGVYARFDGASVATRKLPDNAYCFQSVYCLAGDDAWLCASSAVFQRTAAGERQVASANDEELYGAVPGTAGVIVHSGAQLWRLAVEDRRLIDVSDALDSALMVKSGSTSTSIASNGARIAAGGVRSVLVDDGAGFVEWPGLAVAEPVKRAAPSPAAPRIAKAKSSSPKKPAIKSSKSRR